MICGCQDEHSCECPAAWAGDRNAMTPAVIRALEKRVEELEAQLKAERAAVWKLIDESRQQQARITELEAERDRLRNLVKKSQDEVVSFVPMLVELAALREAAGELVANAEWDGDISTVDTGDLKALRAELLQETPHD